VLIPEIEYDVDHVIEAFRKVVRLVPEDGVVVLNVDDPRVAALASDARASVVRVSLENPGADFSARDIVFSPAGARFTLLEAGLPGAQLASPLAGRHNVRNALGAIALVRGLGLSAGEIARALARFEGVRRRMEVKGEKNGIFVVDDFAHHPTAVRGPLRPPERASGAARRSSSRAQPANQDVRGHYADASPRPTSSPPVFHRNASS
jgi:UDP-N-acetylmuramate: L-alanyl-gamma-D-glutamyl-meso-diaminopimelate ligase